MELRQLVQPVRHLLVQGVGPAFEVEVDVFRDARELAGLNRQRDEQQGYEKKVAHDRPPAGTPAERPGVPQWASTPRIGLGAPASGWHRPRSGRNPHPATLRHGAPAGTAGLQAGMRGASRRAAHVVTPPTSGWRCRSQPAGSVIAGCSSPPAPLSLGAAPRRPRYRWVQPPAGPVIAGCSRPPTPLSLGAAPHRLRYRWVQPPADPVIAGCSRPPAPLSLGAAARPDPRGSPVLSVASDPVLDVASHKPSRKRAASAAATMRSPVPPCSAALPALPH